MQTVSTNDEEDFNIHHLLKQQFVEIVEMRADIRKEKDLRINELEEHIEQKSIIVEEFQALERHAMALNLVIQNG
eukprot:16444271-Heterocapsa_arctica.AAC.1